MDYYSRLRIFIHRLFDIFITWQTIDWAARYRKIKRGDTVIDIGGYFGGFALFAAKRVGSNGKVICFEPDTRNYRILAERIRQRNIKNVLLIKKAVSDKHGQANLFSNFFYSSICDEYEKTKIATLLESVEISTLDSELERIGVNRVDFLKMNIEGAEIEAINGAINSLKNISYLVISSHKRDGKDTVDFIEAVLKKAGFTTKIKSGFRHGFNKKLYAQR